MFYFIEDTFANIYTSIGLEVMLQEKYQADNSEIIKDLYDRTPCFHTPKIKETLEEKYLPPISSADVHPIRNHFIQGDFDGGNLLLILGSPPYFCDENDPEFSIGDVFQNLVIQRGAYLDVNGSPAGLTIAYLKDKPEQWAIIVTKDTHLPKNERKSYILSSVNLGRFVKNQGIIQIHESPSLAESLARLQETTNSLPMQKLLGQILNPETGVMKEHANLFHQLFTGMLSQDQPFSDNQKWMQLIEEHAAELINNPVLIALSELNIKPQTADSILKCLDEHNELTIKLKLILNDESLRFLLKLALNLDELGLLSQLSKFSGDTNQSIQFFNKMAQNPKNHALLKIMLEVNAEKLGIFQLIAKSSEAELLFSKLQEVAEKSVSIINNLMSLYQYFTVPENAPKNLIVPSIIIHFLLDHPDTTVNDEKVKNLIHFLNTTQGVETIDFELLYEFLSKNADQNELLDSVKEPLSKLAMLGITNSEAYKLTLESPSFRRIVNSLPNETANKNNARIELAVNLKKLNQLAAYSQLADNEQWVNSFNRLAKYKTLTTALTTMLSADDVAASCKLLSENKWVPILSAAGIIPVEAVFQADGQLVTILQEIFSDPMLDQSRKNALYQLAIDLEQLTVLGSFEALKQDPNSFLNTVHQLAAVPENQPLLRSMLSGYAPGLGILRLIAKNDINAASLFQNFAHFKDNNEVVTALNWLKENQPEQSKGVPVALNLLFKHPEIQPQTFKKCLEFIKNSPKLNWIRTELSTFMLNHYGNIQLLAEVHATYKKFEHEEITESFYHFALDTGQVGHNFRKIILNQSRQLGESDQLISAFNKFAAYPLAMEILKQRLAADNFLEQCKEILENKRLIALLDAKIYPSFPYQITQLLNPESKQSQAMDALLLLDLKNPEARDLAYKWALVDTPSGNNFRKILAAINPKLKHEIKAQVIETLCLLQMSEKNGFELLLSNSRERKIFQQSILQIEQSCSQIKTRLLAEAPDKAQLFIEAEQEYRTKLYKVVYDNLTSEQPVTKQQLTAQIEESSESMLDVVDQDRHPWIRRALWALTNMLNLIFCTVPSHLLLGKSSFFQHTESGGEIRDLHKSLENTLELKL